ncbi:MAG: type II toxin-antitoxin system Phd/YefM family antitoxin [Burkholderiaceae bacterium]|nr:type II toxin-antitoxin system Phd/YefM family antitoxin [Burkholderiaceae bacterium]NLZ40182.1 type II toxin-antitoxin system prevent-host-death family antitoxin [Comamonadaceae bacterium]
MKTVDVNETERHLLSLLDEVEAGQELILTREGRPVARMSPLPKTRQARVLGRLAGLCAVPADWDAPLPPETIAAFEQPFLLGPSRNS